ncbi:PH domain-containing protein [Actinocorallia longicatena]|uniref:YdbS-like PH domain-containing protein n=1 Tax=Actinocorallia longicatena TaxID=111803 RepID=A0ABP6QS56_9ACTN
MNPSSPAFHPPQHNPWLTHGVHRLHWATAPLRSFMIVVIYFVLFGFSLLLTRNDEDRLVMTPGTVLLFLIVSAPVVAVAVGVGLWTWWAVRFWIDGDDLVVDSGIVRSRIRRIPLSRMQGVDVVRPLISRALSLAEVRLELAGGTSAEITLRYLSDRRAQQLRAELLALAAGLPGRTPEAPERPFYRVPFLTLFASLVFKIPVIIACCAFVALIGFGIWAGELAVVAAVVPVLLGLLRGVVAPMVMYTDFRCSISPDGLRLRYGLFETRLQTLPPGRIQAVRVVEPRLWRTYGWARVEVTVAGYGGERQALSSTLLPVAPRAVAFAMISEVFPGVALAEIPFKEGRSRLEPEAAAGSSRDVFVTRRGAFCRTWDVVAFARAQSVRLTSTPLQRLQGLATVHVDVPPGPVHVSAVDRDLAEARELGEDTLRRSLNAQARSGSPERWAR